LCAQLLFISRSFTRFRKQLRGAVGSSPSFVAPPTVEHHRLAPEGVFYLMDRVSIKTASGVAGFAPGTLVRMVQDKGETFVVTADSTTFEVPADNLTNDIDLAYLVARKDATSQNMIANFIRKQNEADRQGREANIAMLEQQQRDVDAARAAAEAAKPH
jgi:hypothetical protein